MNTASVSKHNIITERYAGRLSHLAPPYRPRIRNSNYLVAKPSFLAHSNVRHTSFSFLAEFLCSPRICTTATCRRYIVMCYTHHIALDGRDTISGVRG